MGVQLIRLLIVFSIAHSISINEQKSITWLLFLSVAVNIKNIYLTASTSVITTEIWDSYSPSQQINKMRISNTRDLRLQKYEV